MTTVRVALPVHLQTLAKVEGEVRVVLEGEPTITSVIDAIESRYPMLKGTIRDHRTEKRRAFIRYFASGEDVSHAPPDTPLPAAVVAGAEVFSVIGAISGG